MPSRHLIIRSTIAIVLLLAIVGVTVFPAFAQGTPNIRTRLIFAPKHAKACETFLVIFALTNRGSDFASNVEVQFNVPDQFEVRKVLGTPVNLAPGKSKLVTAVIKVVAFVPGESRSAWVTLNDVTVPIKLIGKQVLTCP